MAIIKTRKGEKIIVDDNLFEILNQFTWVIKNGYVYTALKSKGIYLHRLVVGAVVDNKKKVVDHINRNPLDNRRCNLRLVCESTNVQRTRKKTDVTFIGVKLRNSKFATYFCGKYSGLFKTSIDAARHYDKLAVKKFGIHALTNRRFFIDIVKKLSE